MPGLAREIASLLHIIRVFLSWDLKIAFVVMKTAGSKRTLPKYQLTLYKVNRLHFLFFHSGCYGSFIFSINLYSYFIVTLTSQVHVRGDLNFFPRVFH